MKISGGVMMLVLLCAGLAWQGHAADGQANPLQKVLQMLGDMQGKIIKDGEAQQHAYHEFSNMCENRAMELQHEIKIANSEVEDLKATINKANDDEGEADSEIEGLSSSLSTAEADLKAATIIRKKEVADFGENQKDLIDTIGQMERAISILEKQKAGASLAQTPRSRSVTEFQDQRAAELTEALAAIVDASFINTADAHGLAAFIQSSESTSDGDSESNSDMQFDSESFTQKKDKSSIMDTLETLLEKAQDSLESARTKETKSAYNFALFKGSLERKIQVDGKDMAEVKKEKAEAGQTRAQAQGDLEVVKKNLDEDIRGLEQLHHECMTRAADFEDETKSRDEELKALATAKKVLKEMTGGAEKGTYAELVQVSFLQTRSQTKSVSVTSQAVDMVRQLGEKQNLPKLVQMSHKMLSVVHSSVMSGVDPFKKVKGMITTMTSKLVKQMEEEASHKVYCDKEMTETTKHVAAKESAVEKLSTRMDTQTSTSMNLKRQVAELQKELLANQVTQREMDRMRNQEHAVFEKTKPELEMGISGVKKALQVLREYYSQDEDKDHEASGGAGGGIIQMLEVVESDFSKGLANLVAEEETAQSAYEVQTHENQLSKAIKDKDVVFKTKQAKSLDKSTSETSTDLDGVQTELDAVKEYFNKIQEECVAKPDSYEERRKRQQQTLQGLQDAAELLEGKAALVQSSRRMRGSNLLRGSDQDGDHDDASA